MRVAAAVGLALTSIGALAQEPIRVGVDAVLVDVLVTDGSRPVGGLSAADFELMDSGVLQRIEAVSFEDVPLSVTLALDASASVRGPALDHLKQAATAVAALLKGDDRAALLTFAEEVDLRSPWSADRQALERAIALTRASGSTALHDAAYAALTLKDSSGGRALVLLFSDGDDTASWLPGRTVIDHARRSDAVVYSVGLRTSNVHKLGYLADFRTGLQPGIPPVVPTELTKPFLTALAEETGGKYLDTDRPDRLRDAFVQIVTEFRSRYLLTYTPAGVAAGGWHPIDVKVKDRKLTVVARRGYLR
jgi:VWFA-related protein